ncbi:hypothetical protein H4219_006136 [Mycoemilia scoparia]|uniref:Uncharacterized protein n=1 Tax=Mycoemilia scoparia TaxID=417184 RepID=A0A9W8DJK0_9FUNG|nr:hypothetical protein H4219_006136 [Mycoemilia scoparia]
MSEIVTASKTKLQAILWESLGLVTRLTEPHPNSTVTKENLLFALDSHYLLPIARRIADIYNSQISQLPIPERQEFIIYIFEKLRLYVQVCQEKNWSKIQEYQASLKGDQISGREEAFDNFVKFKPTIVYDGLDRFFGDFYLVIYQRQIDIPPSGSGGKQALPPPPPPVVDNGKDLATLLCKFVGFTRTTAAYLGICRFAVDRFEKGDVEGCRNLLSKVEESPFLIELEDYKVSRLDKLILELFGRDALPGC